MRPFKLTTLLLFCVLLCGVAEAQVDTTAKVIYHPDPIDSLTKAVEKTWMQPRTDGRLWHELPPPANIVNGGYAIQYAGMAKRDARWMRIVGIGLGAVLWTQNENVGYAVGGIAIGYSTVLDFRSSKSMGEAGRLLRNGYSVNERYDLVPDSIADGVRERLIPQRFR
ncbi:MAG TPA: hypothetical protein PLB89_05275 [Flavobacteriales bacterium]|nr:hypothetical protein [Flavobacteriales bacterium]